jgi:hypothetical protein
VVISVADTKTLADEFAAATDALRRAAERASTGGSPEDRLARALLEPVYVWLESWQGVHLSVDGPMPQDFEHALKIVRIVNGRDHG